MRLALAFGFALLLAAGGSAATPPAPAPEFGERVDVRLVNVDVYVLDRDGRPVTGLAAADFEVLEDGRRVEVANFAELAEPSAKPTAGKDSDTTPAGADAAQTAAPEPITVALYFDDLFLRPPAGYSTPKAATTSSSHSPTPTPRSSRPTPAARSRA